MIGLVGCRMNSTTQGIEHLNYDIVSDYLPRVNFGQKFEPKGNYILHGAGQIPNTGSWISFDDYVSAMGEAHLMPVMNVAYAAPHRDMAAWNEAMNLELAAHPSTLLQIGVHFNGGEWSTNPYYQRIADGEMDEELLNLITMFEAFDRPVYVRPGFEFNGEWNKYTDAEIYKRAFIRFCELIKSHGAQNIAIVWCYNPDALEKNYLKYYPGDEYVDWWAIDIFRIGSVESWNTVKFLEDAEAHRKPVMLSEVTPFTYDVTKNEGWDEWFVPFFDFVKNNPVIKAVCYINWKWTDYPQWSNWGDARLEHSTTVKQRYAAELADPVYLHDDAQSDLRTHLYLETIVVR